MKNNIYPKNYQSVLNLVDTQIAIKLIKDTFERELAKDLELIRVSAPLFVEPNTGLNDNLSGYEKAVNFIVNQNDKDLENIEKIDMKILETKKEFGSSQEKKFRKQTDELEDQYHKIIETNIQRERYINKKEQKDSQECKIF